MSIEAKGKHAEIQACPKKKATPIAFSFGVSVPDRTASFGFFVARVILPTAHFRQLELPD